MTRSRLNPQIDEQIARLAKTDRSVPLSEVGSILRSILSQMPLAPVAETGKKQAPSGEKYSIQEMFDEVEINAVRDFVLPNIERELAAIVEATASATQSILGAVEKIEQTNTDTNDSVQMSVRDSATRIYEACSFQDITGQRMSKIITLLKGLEMRIEGLMGLSGDEAALERYYELKKLQDKEKVAKEFLQGPQLTDAATSQEDIDKLFAD